MENVSTTIHEWPVSNMKHDLLVLVAPISNSALPENLCDLMRLMMTSHVYMF